MIGSPLGSDAALTLAVTLSALAGLVGVRVNPLACGMLTVVAAFAGVEGQSQWVLLAQDSLKRAEDTARELAAVDEAIKLAEQESNQQAETRLKALLQLYRESEPARKRVEAALTKLRERAGS